MSDDWEEFSKNAEGVLLYYYERVKHEQYGRTVRDYQSLSHVAHMPGNHWIWTPKDGREKLREIETRYSTYRKEISRGTGVITYMFTNIRQADREKLYQRYLEDKAENFGYE